MANNREKETFCKGLAWKLDFRWFDKTGIVKLPNGNVGCITLETRGTMSHYEGFQVTVRNSKEGEVVEKYFQFDDYLSERSDARPSYKDGFMVISTIKWEWYIAVPKDTRPFCEAVESFLEAFGG